MKTAIQILTILLLLPSCGHEYKRDYSLPFYTYFPDRLPIVVKPEIELRQAERTIDAVLNIAMAWWQTALDTDTLVFSRDSNNPNSFILPINNRLYGEHVLGRILFNNGNHDEPIIPVSMEFQLNTEMSIDMSTEQLFVVVLHEFGHVLGLRHLMWIWDDKFNVMWPATELGATRIEEEQLELIREGFGL